MNNLPAIDSGQGGWDKVLNQIIANLNSSVTSSTADSGWITSGITLINGFTNFNETNYDILQYRYVSMGGVKTALMLTGGLKVPANFPTDAWMPLATFPNDLSQFFLSHPTVQQGLTCFTNSGAIAAASFNPSTNTMSVRSKSAISEGTRFQINYIGIA